MTRKTDGALEGATLTLVATSNAHSGPRDLDLSVRTLPGPLDADLTACCTYQPDALWIAERADAPVRSAQSADRIGQAGIAQFSQSRRGAWTTVSFSETLTNPVVVAGPPSYRGPQPTTLRVRKTRPDRFEIRMDEWDYLDGGHTTETVPWLAINAGRHTLADGRRVEAGHAEDVEEGWSSASFSASFDRLPIVLVQVVSDKSHATVTARVRNVTRSGFHIQIQREGAPTESVRPETVSWIAFEAADGEGWTASGAAGVAYGVGRTENTVTHSPTTISFAERFAEAPAVLAAMQTFDGGDPAALRAPTTTGSGWSVFVEEEESRDSEVQHTTEVVGWVAVAPGALLGSRDGSQTVSAPVAGSSKRSLTAISDVVAGVALPTSLILDGVHPNPSRQTARVRYGLPEEASVTIEIFDALGRRVEVLVDGRLAGGWHEADVGGADLPAGLYVVRLQAGSVVRSKPFTVVR